MWLSNKEHIPNWTLRLTRIYKADFEIAPQLFARVLETLKADHSSAESLWISREDEVVVVRKELTPDLILRYETNVDRQIGRTLDQIKQLRNMRGGNAELTQRPLELEVSDAETNTAS